MTSPNTRADIGVRGRPPSSVEVVVRASPTRAHFHGLLCLAAGSVGASADAVESVKAAPSVRLVVAVLELGDTGGHRSHSDIVHLLREVARWPASTLLRLEERFAEAR